MGSNPPQAISPFADGFAIQYRQSIIDFGLRKGVPMVSSWPAFARSGALFTYGPHLDSSYRRLAHYADRILQGARPPDLPIEQPTKFELMVNLKTAKALGLTIPSALLATEGRVEMWRGGFRSNISVSAPFVWRCLIGSAVAPFPHLAHRTGHADLPHPALGQDFTPSPTTRRAQAQSNVRARSARKGARVDRSRPCVA
jgi:hypothetical protein